MYMSPKPVTVAKEPSAAFRGVPLNVLQLNWSEVSASRVWVCGGFSLFLAIVGCFYVVQIV